MPVTVQIRWIEELKRELARLSALVAGQAGAQTPRWRVRGSWRLGL
jgi:hypothetical protein